MDRGVRTADWLGVRDRAVRTAAWFGVGLGQENKI
jgi:hypothetical protein